MPIYMLCLTLVCLLLGLAIWLGVYAYLAITNEDIEVRPVRSFDDLFE